METTPTRRKYPEYVHRLEDIPNKECWIIIKNLNIHTEGDERSRTNPGHGYPAGTDHYVQVYTVFTNEDEFKAELENEINDRFGGGAKGFKVTPYVAKTTIEITPVKP
jgi:hypothetical protein